MQQSTFADRVGLTRASVNHILQRHAATGIWFQSTEAHRETASRQDHALFKMVRQDPFISARGLMVLMRNLYGIRAGW